MIHYIEDILAVSLDLKRHRELTVVGVGGSIVARPC